jgi:hypothetical protein
MYKRKLQPQTNNIMKQFLLILRYKTAFFLSIACSLLIPFTMIAQVKERQAGDTTYYKTLIPEEKQGLLKNMSMIANMRFAMRNEFEDGDYKHTRFTY